jgi:hypothetical protein
MTINSMMQRPCDDPLRDVRAYRNPSSPSI